MSHEAREAKTGEEEKEVEERRGFCLAEWFMEKKMLSVAGGGYLFIYLFYIYIYIIFLIRVANLHTYTISNMRYFNTIITGKKVQKKN